MKLSTRARYGLRALVDIALYCEKKPVILKDIAERQNISRLYLAQLILELQKSGFVKSIKGRKGGFILSKDPSDIFLLDVIASLEKNISLVECIEDSNKCSKSSNCITQKLWQHLDNVLKQTLSSYTLQDLLNSK